jgi:uncharacterized protein (DUF58 family)
MLTFLAVLVALGLVLELLSLRDNISGIDYCCSSAKSGYEAGEVFQLKTTITNYGARTVPFLKLIEVLPKKLDILNEAKVEEEHRNRLSASVIYIRGRQKITRTAQVSLPHRGLYLLEGCRLFCGDFLGIREKLREINQWEEIIIFPPLLEENRILRALSGYYGDFSVRRFYIEDPILVNSYHDYTGREPMRSVSWTQSAKKNRLMVKEFDHTAEMSVTILLDVYLHWSDWDHMEEVEYCFSLARTVAEFMEKKQVSYRLLTNASARSRDAANEGVVNAGRGARHYKMLLHTLGQAAADTFCNVDRLYDIVVKNYAGENAILYVAPFRTEQRDHLVKNLQKRLGNQVYPMYAASMTKEK